jgi:beta-lactamase superfamily II metal-dependent hydrolase
MPVSVGWIRAYRDELQRFGYRDRDHKERDARAAFREAFFTTLRAGPDDTAAEIGVLSWADIVELPSGLSDEEWTRASFEGQDGFLRTAHLVEIAYVDRRAGVNGFRTTLSYERRESDGDVKTVRITLLWGDCVQIIRRDGDTCYGRARAFYGDIPSAHLTSEPLLEVYFVDVGQGDGVLVRTPDVRHLLVDGGLERAKQLTGKNVADFVDWKFYADYGHFEITLDSMTASHSDNDHYGGLHDLVRRGSVTERELDCRRTRIGTFHHPGLSRWEKRVDADPPHKDGLGARIDDDGAYFVRLLDDRADAEGAIINHAPDELSGPWKWFIRDLLANSDDTGVERVGVARETLAENALPSLWDDTDGYEIKVLAPVTAAKSGSPALPDLGDRGYNTNGHSICYRIDYGNARILLTGDLNRPSMDWLTASYGDLMGAWRCDVAKACHHGSHKVSYRFLQAMQPAATIISSGDAEGHAHPRPEIVAASAVSGRIEIDLEKDILVTPLVYMTEIERSVSLGALDRLDVSGLPGSSGTSDFAVPGRYVDELNDRALLSEDQEQQIQAAPEDEKKSLRTRLRKENRDRFRAVEEGREAGTFTAKFSMTVPRGPLSAEYRSRPMWRARILDKNHYGLVNVRSDGDVIMCATLNETESDWLIHTFVARANLPWEPR